MILSHHAARILLTLFMLSFVDAVAAPRPVTAQPEEFSAIIRIEQGSNAPMEMTYWIAADQLSLKAVVHLAEIVQSARKLKILHYLGRESEALAIVSGAATHALDMAAEGHPTARHGPGFVGAVHGGGIDQRFARCRIALSKHVVTIACSVLV